MLWRILDVHNLYRPNVNISKKLQTITENNSIMEYFQMMRKQNQSGHKIVTVCMYLSCNWSNNHHIATRVLYRNSRHNHIQCNGHFVIDLNVHLYIALSIQKELEESTASNWNSGLHVFIFTVWLEGRIKA